MTTSFRVAVALIVGALASGMAGCVDHGQGDGSEGAPEETPNGSTTGSGPVVTLQELLDSAVAVYFSGDEPTARDMLTEGLAQARADEDVRAEARALTYLGLVAWRLYEWDEAERLGVEALRLKTEQGLTDDLFTSHNALGLLRYYQNRFPEAARHFEAAIRLSEQSPRPDAAVSARQNLALVQTEWGQFAAAREGFLAMRDSMLGIGDRISADRRARGLGAALTNLGMLENRVGNPSAAVEWLEEARRAYREGFPEYEFFALGHLAISHSMLGNHQEAYDVIGSAIELARELDDLQEEASNLEVLAEHYREAGDYRRALDLYAQARALNDELGETVATGADLRGEAEIHLALGAPERAVERATEALRLHEEAGATYEELYDHLVLASVNQELERSDDVGSHLEAARRLTETLDARGARVAVGLAEAIVAEEWDLPRRALTTLRRLRADIELGTYDEQWRSHHLAAKAYRSLGMLDSAVVEGWSAVETVERVRRGYESGLLSTSFAADRRDVYAELIETLVARGETGAALSVSDRARGESLRQRGILAGREWRGESGEMLLREIQAVSETIELIENGENAWIWDASVDRLALAELYERLTDLRMAVDDAPSPVDAGGGAGEADLPRVGTLEGALAPQEVLLHYFVPENGPARIFVVREGRVDALRTSVSARNLRSRVRLARELLSSGPAGGGDARTVLRGLYEALIGPVASAGHLEGASGIVFMPHDILAYAPASSWLNPSTDRYLGEDFRIRIVPSLDQLRGSGDPSDQRGSSVFAPLTAELPATAEETVAVSSAIGGAHQLVDADATEAEFRRALSRDRIVHVATHGVMNVHNPLFSRVLFAEGEGGPEDDGEFQVHELLDLESRVSLLFLSGCETGLGRAGETRFAPGEDYLTLGHAFLRSGVENVIATLWRVDDRAAATFAEHFYQELRSSPPAEALAEAQRRMRADSTFSAPFYWAGYQLLGGREFTAAEAP